MGFDSRAAGGDDMKAMGRLLARRSTPAPSAFRPASCTRPAPTRNTAELIGLAKTMKARGGLYFSHIRGESSMLLDSIAEAIRIGDEGGVGVEVSHVKASGRENCRRSTPPYA